MPNLCAGPAAHTAAILSSRALAVQQHGEGRLHSGDAAPHAEEILVALHGERGRGVIAPDDIDLAAQERRAQRIALTGGTKGRRALGYGADAQHVLFGEIEIVGAGFDREIRAARAGLQSFRHAAAAG